ncbi:VCBS domain-containing protein, partial [Ramlibacter sp. AW1]
MASMTFLINDTSTEKGTTPVVQVTITEQADGTLLFQVTQLAGMVGDFRGLFFDVANESLIGTMKILSCTSTVTEFQQGDDKIVDLGGGANMHGLTGDNGGYDAGLEIGTSGLGKDDVRSFSFLLDSSLRNLTLADFSEVAFGARITSVGMDANLDGTFETSRSGSSKTGETTFRVISPADDTACATEDASAIGNVLYNDGASALDVLTVTGWSGGVLGSAIAIPGLNGATVRLNADGSYTIDATDANSLAAGQKVSHTFTYTVRQTNVDGSSTQTASFTVTITGTNDVPVVATEDVTGAVAELVSPAGDLTDSGTISFSDVDLTDVHSVSAVTASSGALGTLTASVTTDTTGNGTGGVVTWNYSV